MKETVNSWFAQIMKPHQVGLCRVRCSHILLPVFFFLTISGLKGQASTDSSEIYFRTASLLAYRGVYDSSIFTFQKASYGFFTSGRKFEGLLSEIKIADVMNQKGAFNDASMQFDSLEKKIFSSTSPDLSIVSELYQVQGNYFLLTGRLDSAHLLLKRALNIKLKYQSQPDSSFAYVYSKLGNYAYMVGNYDSAYVFYTLALQMSSQKKEPENFERSLYLQSIGIAQTLKGLYQDAENSFLSSLEISKIYLKDSDPALARLYLNLGRFYYSITKNEDAYQCFLKSEKIFSKTLSKNNSTLAYIYWNIGIYFISNGDLAESINYLKQAYFIFSQILPEKDPRIQALLMDIGVAYENKGDLNEAIKYYQQSININPTPSVIKSYRNLAHAYSVNENIPMAEESYRKSISIAQMFEGEADHDLALCYRYYGEFLVQVKRDSKGLNYYEKALSILQRIFLRDHEDIARIYLLFGEYYLTDLQFDEAKKYSDKAIHSVAGEKVSLIDLSSLGQGSFEYGLMVSEVLDFRARVLYGLFGKYQDIQYLHECLNTVDAAVTNLNGLRMSYTTEESKLILMRRAKATINTGISCAYTLYKITGEESFASKVFELGEKSKSIVLLNTMRGLEALKMSDIPAELTDKEHRIKSDLLSYNSLIYKEQQKKSPDDKMIELWQSMAFELKKQYDSLVSSFESDYPMFYQLKYDNSIISADSVSTLLATDQALVEYSRYDSAIYFTLITTENISCFQYIDEEDSLSLAIDRFNRLMRNSELGNYNREHFSDYTSSAYLIYNKLIRPMDHIVMGKKLILIPDDDLSYISFDALLTEKPSVEEPDYRKLSYLIMRQPISYSSSATILFGLEKKKGSRISSKILAFAPSYAVEVAGSSLRGSEPGIDSLRLLPIKGVEEEVNRILSIFRGIEFSGEEATELNFKKDAGRYNVLHLAMHTLIDDKNPLFSKMVFTSGGGEGEDGLLNTYELFSLDLQGSLGVLSACNTGFGKLERGEGIMSLARGFIYAGIPSLAMTLWEIDDKSSSDIMAFFYAHLKEGLPTDVALQHAKLEYISTADKYKSHPSYWAGFVNIGKTASVKTPGSFTHYWWVPVALIIIIITFFINRQVYLRKKSD